MNIKDIDNELLIFQWNKIFDQNISLTTNSNDVENIFNQYLSLSNKNNYIYKDNVLLCLQNEKNKINIYYIKNNILINEIISINDKKKFINLISQYTIIITNFSISNDMIKNHIFYRYEIINNYLCGYNCNFFGKDYLYSNTEYIGIFIDKIQKIINKHPLIKFASMLLNYFESGNIFGNIFFKPTVTISQYGRWYFSGTYKIQNSIHDRMFFIKSIKDQGNKIISLDIKAAEGTEFYNLTKSPLVKKLLDNRNIDGQISEISKLLINIIIHSERNVDVISYLIHKKYSSNIIELCYPNFENMIIKILDEISIYDNNIMNKYRNNISIKENYRRIINPLTSSNIYDKLCIKEHFKYVQGYVIDKLLIFGVFIFKKLNILPIAIIHDELLYICNDDIIFNNIENILLKYNIKMSLEVY